MKAPTGGRWRTPPITRSCGGGVSVGAAGASMSQQHLRNTLACLDMLTLNQPEAFIQWKDGLIGGAGEIGKQSRKFVRGWMDRYVEWVKRYATPAA